MALQHSGIEVFCKNIKRLRVAHKLSKKEMAQILDIGTGSLSKLERGMLPPQMSCTVLYRIHDYFGISLSNLFCENCDEYFLI